jgi:Cu-Zn family superoxide dismutase
MHFIFLIRSAILACALICFSLFSHAVTSKNIQVVLTTAPALRAVGILDFKQLKDNKIQITGKITGLTPGDHGIHIHTVGDCSDPDKGFLKAGDHFNPDSSHHGSLQSGHRGDLGNIVANAKGEAVFKIEVGKFNLIPNDKYSILDRAVVIHIAHDDEKTDPAGNSGARILCGVIKS